MKIQIKKTIKAGNSSAVILPRAWLNKNVRVELIRKNKSTILNESLQILEKNILLEEIKGIYLTGSYARNEEDENSDIDILVITKNTDKKTIYEGIYNILIISEKLLNQKLKNDLLPIGQMIKEAKALINSDYLNSIKINITKKNINWHIKTTKEKINLIEKILKILRTKGIKEIDKKITYTLILRIRTIHIIKKLIKKEKYSKKEFQKLIKRISKSNLPYENYLEVKENSDKLQKSKIEENEKLLIYLKEELKNLEKII